MPSCRLAPAPPPRLLPATPPFCPTPCPAQIRDLSLKFLWIGLASFVASYIEMAAWMWSGNRQANRLRGQYLAALLQQEVAFFDTQSTTGGALQGLNEDCQLIQVGGAQGVQASWLAAAAASRRLQGRPGCAAGLCRLASLPSCRAGPGCERSTAGPALSTPWLRPLAPLPPR